MLPLLMALIGVPSDDVRIAGEWKVEKEANRIVVSQAGSAAWPSPDGSGPGTHPRIVLRCANGVKEGYLFYEEGFPVAGDVFITYDDLPGKPQKYNGKPSTDWKSLFLIGPGLFDSGPDAFIRTMREHSKMTLVTKLKKRNPLPEETFDLRLLDDALTEWLAACPIKPKKK